MTYLQKGIWWYEFTFAGKLIRKSSESRDRAIARQLEATHRHELEDGQGIVTKATEQANQSTSERLRKRNIHSPRTPPSASPCAAHDAFRVRVSEQRKRKPIFSEAAAAWLTERKRYIKPNTVRSYQDAIKALTPYFAKLHLDRIQIDHIRRYQDLRAERITPRIVNREVGILQQVMKEYDQWSRLQSRYRALREAPHRAGHSLSADEEARLCQVAFSKPKWRVAAHCMMLMLNTTMGFGELRQLRRRDVDIDNAERSSVTVREGAKNEYRHRTIPLNNQARESMTWILERWKKLGGNDPEHYILPHRPRGQRAEHWRKSIPWILTEPTTAMTTAFESIRKAAGLPHFRLYDCRVQAITKLLSDPTVSPQVSREIAGHISQAMQSRYSIQQFSTKKAALDGLVTPPSAPIDPLKNNLIPFSERSRASA